MRDDKNRNHLGMVTTDWCNYFNILNNERFIYQL